MNSLNDINEFLQPETIAIAGVSRNPKKFSRVIYNNLKKKNFDIVPVNPNTDSIDGDKCYRDVIELPDSIKKLLVTTPKNVTASVIDGAIKKGIDRIWIQQGSDTLEAAKIAKKNNVKLVSGECVMLHAKPVKGIHGVHRFLRTVFGRMPK